MENNWDYSITSKKSIFSLNYIEIWRYRDLLWILVKKDFVSLYKQTVLGPIWLVIQPLFTTFIYVFIFGNLAQLSTDGLPKPLFYLTGVVGWTFFSECITKTSSVFLANSNIFAKVYFPRLIMPLSIFLSSIIRMSIQFFLLICLTVYFVVSKGFVFQFQLQILYIPLIIICLSFVGLGIGMIISSLTTKYRDINHVFIFGIQLLMYATPVVYPLSNTPLKYRKILEFNPLSNLIEGLRISFLGTSQFDPSTLIYPFLFSIGIFVLGIFIFNIAEKDFVDTI
jgi:lipopolysaccharide transport system permease protein